MQPLSSPSLRAPGTGAPHRSRRTKRAVHTLVALVVASLAVLHAGPASAEDEEAGEPVVQLDPVTITGPRLYPDTRTRDYFNTRKWFAMQEPDPARQKELLQDIEDIEMMMEAFRYMELVPSEPPAQVCTRAGRTAQQLRALVGTGSRSSAPDRLAAAQVAVDILAADEGGDLLNRFGVGEIMRAFQLRWSDGTISSFELSGTSVVSEFTFGLRTAYSARDTYTQAAEKIEAGVGCR